jgi:hypothetical protein
MAISHADHDHPNTPAARAKCRKSMASSGAPAQILSIKTGKLVDVPPPVKMTVVPRHRGDGGVVQGMKATEPKAATRRLKVSGSLINSTGHLADVPAVLATEVRRAWKLDWTVQAGHPFNDDERRIVITGPVAEIALVWDSNGRTGIFIRNLNSSVTRRLDTPDEAFDAADTEDAWDGHGNYTGL